jgi:hypothetical protein
LASVRTLGLASNPSSLSLQPLGRLIELEDNNRLVFLRTDGSVFASTRLPRSGGDVETISGGPVIGQETSAVAFAGQETSAVAFAAAPDQAPGGFGLEHVYVLRAGAHQAVSIHGASVNLTTCERGANLQWHGSWLLYSNTEHDLAAIDTMGAHRTIALNKIVKRLPGTRGGFSAFWSDQPTMW